MKKIFNYFLLLILLSCSNNIEKESPYKLIANWPKIPDNYVLGNPTGLAIKSNQNLVVFHRASRSWQTPYA
jgi:peptidylamidoglycolate lyase